MSGWESFVLVDFADRDGSLSFPGCISGLLWSSDDGYPGEVDKVLADHSCLFREPV
jgi:hypothetical protein